MTQVIYKFKQGEADGNASMKDVLGGKGANLAEMANLGLPVPEGFTIPTEQSINFLNSGYQSNLLDPSYKYNFLNSVVELAMDVVSEFESADSLMLWSVRSGARVSMPGMMDTILNIGITEQMLPYWEDRLGRRVALDCRRRLMQMYGAVVFGIPAKEFESKIKVVKKIAVGGVRPVEDCDLTEAHLEQLIVLYGNIYEAHGVKLPETVRGQLEGAIMAVWNSWNSDRAKAYRADHNIPDDWGTAVNVQRMVFGNMNDKSGSGVLFSRCPKTGVKGVVGEFLANAQGEEVVSGSRQPLDLTQMFDWNHNIYTDLTRTALEMEAHYRDMQDMEFTVEDGKLFILQTRSGKREALAKFQIAYDMAVEGLIDQQTALNRVSGDDYAVLLRDRVDPDYDVEPDFLGLGASGGIATGIAVYDATGALSNPANILVREETSPDDYEAMVASAAIVTEVGGETSHAAVVARSINKPCVVGVENIIEELPVDAKVTVDGFTGRIWVNKTVPVIPGEVPQFVCEMMDWARKVCPIITKLEPNTPVAVPEEGYFQIVAGAVNTGKSFRKEFTNLLLRLKECDDLGGIIDLNSISNPDADYLYFIGQCASQEGGIPLDMDIIVNISKQVRWTKKFKRRWTLRLPATVTQEQREALVEKGWKVTGVVDSLKDMWAVNGMYEASEGFLQTLTDQGIDLTMLTGTLEAAGHVVEPLPVTATEEEIPFVLFGEAC